MEMLKAKLYQIAKQQHMDKIDDIKGVQKDVYKRQGWDLSGETAAVIVFVLWGTAEMSDLVRGALIAIPKHQYESSEALGRCV